MTSSQNKTLARALPPEASFPLPARRKEKKVQRTRRVIAEVAISLFVEKGFSATTIDEIVEAADYSTSTFFRLFKDKEEVVFYDFDERLEELKEAFATPHEGNAWSLIRRVFIDFAHQLDEGGDIFRHRARLFHREPMLKARYLGKNHQWEDVIASLILNDIGSGSDSLTAYLIAGAAVSAFRVAWEFQQHHEDIPLGECVERSFNRLEDLGSFFNSE